MKRNNLGQYIKVEPKDRFWDKVEKTDYCWNWIGKKRKDGYGVISINGKSVRVHRFIMNQHNPSIKVLHRCDNPGCVNPDHLFIGTQLDNIKDMLKKNRNKYFGTIGCDNPQSRLTKNDVLEIKKKHNLDKVTENILSREYGVSQQAISKIIKGKSYYNIQ